MFKGKTVFLLKFNSGSVPRKVFLKLFLSFTMVWFNNCTYMLLSESPTLVGTGCIVLKCNFSNIY